MTCESGHDICVLDEASNELYCSLCPARWTRASAEAEPITREMLKAGAAVWQAWEGSDSPDVFKDLVEPLYRAMRVAAK